MHMIPHTQMQLIPWALFENRSLQMVADILRNARVDRKVMVVNDDKIRQYRLLARSFDVALIGSHPVVGQHFILRHLRHGAVVLSVCRRYPGDPVDPIIAGDALVAITAYGATSTAAAAGDMSPAHPPVVEMMLNHMSCPADKASRVPGCVEGGAADSGLKIGAAGTVGGPVALGTVVHVDIDSCSKGENQQS